MPHLTDTLYLKNHQCLKKAWLGPAIAALTPEDKQLLQAYYLPDHSMTPEDLLTRRRIVLQAHPSLPSRAGKAFHRFQVLVNHEAGVQPNRAQHRHPATTSQTRRLSIRAIRRSDPDVRKLASAFIAMATREASQSGADSDAR